MREKVMFFKLRRASKNQGVKYSAKIQGCTCKVPPRNHIGIIWINPTCDFYNFFTELRVLFFAPRGYF